MNLVTALTLATNSSDSVTSDLDGRLFFAGMRIVHVTFILSWEISCLPLCNVVAQENDTSTVDRVHS